MTLGGTLCCKLFWCIGVVFLMQNIKNKDHRSINTQIYIFCFDGKKCVNLCKSCVTYTNFGQQQGYINQDLQITLYFTESLIKSKLLPPPCSCTAHYQLVQSLLYITMSQGSLFSVDKIHSFLEIVSCKTFSITRIND